VGDLGSTVKYVEEDEGRDTVEEEDLMVVEGSDPSRLVLDADLLIEGVSKLSRAFGSSSRVYLPMAG